MTRAGRSKLPTIRTQAARQSVIGVGEILGTHVNASTPVPGKVCNGTVAGLGRVSSRGLLLANASPKREREFRFGLVVEVDRHARRVRNKAVRARDCAVASTAATHELLLGVGMFGGIYALAFAKIVAQAMLRNSREAPVLKCVREVAWRSDERENTFRAHLAEHLHRQLGVVPHEEGLVFNTRVDLVFDHRRTRWFMTLKKEPDN
jgi:hypothetical protein